MTVATNIHDDFQLLLDASQDALRARWSIYERIRESEPIFRHGPVTFVTRFSDVNQILLDPKSFHSGPSNTGVPESRVAGFSAEERKAFQGIVDYESRWMTMVNGDRHERIRALGVRVFSPRAVQQLQGQIERTVQDLLSELRLRGRADYIEDYAYKLPLRVISDLLEIPDEMVMPLHRAWKQLLPARAGMAWRSGLPTGLVDAHAGYVSVHDQMYDLLRMQRGRSKSLIMQNISEALDDDRVEEADVVAVMVNFFTAGHQTTQDLLGNALVAFAENPDQWELVKRDPTLVRNAVEEVLRFRSPVQDVERFTAVDVEMAGTTIDSGTQVTLSLGSAGRDPDQFTAPNEFDVTREDANKHMAFGRGAHFCLGAALARMEAAATIHYLAENCPDITLLTDPPIFVESTHGCGYKELPVDFGRSAH
jgi:cytochrome P450